MIVHRASRGRLAAALELDVLVDDTVAHCVDVLEMSRTKPIFVCRKPDPVAETNAERLGITVCRSAAEALDVIVRQESRSGSRQSQRRRPAKRTGRPT